MASRRLAFVTTALAPLAAAVLGPTGANNATTPTSESGNITIHYVTAGKTNNEFVPNSLVANVGDIVSFQFYPLNHSVIRSAYGWPCIPVQDTPSDATPFFSGFQPSDENSNPPTWNLTVNSTEPIWYYCGAPGSCIDWGMLGVINPDAETSIATQIKLAREAKVMLLPGQEFESEAQEASFSSLAHSATAATKTVTHTASMSMPPTNSSTSSTASHGVSGGVAAGIAIGAAAAALVIAALFFLLYRTKKLKKKLDKERIASMSHRSWIDPAMLNSHGAIVQSPPTSHTPSYIPYYELGRPDPTKAARVESWVIDGGRPSPRSPYAVFSAHESSELSTGDVPIAAELDTPITGRWA